MQHNTSAREASIASNVLLTAFVAGLAINFFTKTGFFDKNGLPVPVWIPVIIMVLARYIFYKVKQDKLWAKIVCAILVGFALLQSIGTLYLITRSHLTVMSSLENVNFILQLLLLLIMAIAVGYSFRRPATKQYSELPSQ